MTDTPHDPPASISFSSPHATPVWQVESFGSSMVRARVTQTSILAECTKQGFSQDDLFAIRLALEEALINAVKHGNDGNPTKVVRVRYRITADGLEVVIEDEGLGFDPATLPDPTSDENLTVPAGRGILLMRAYMDTVVFSPKGNSVRMTKRRAS